MSKTNTGLVAHAEKALKEGWYYGWGAYGQKATTTLVNSLVNQYVSMNTQWKSYMLKAVSAGTRLCDCYGLVKSYLWWTSDSGNPQYKAAQDRNTAGAYSAAKEKGPLSTLPEIPGVILYMSGHVGVYCGNGRFIELQGGGTGAYEGKIENGKITRGSKFTQWFKDTFIDYSGTVEQEEEMTQEKFNEMMAVYNVQLQKQAASDWAKENWNEAVEKGVFDGTMPRAPFTREQAATVLKKLKLF